MCAYILLCIIYKFMQMHVFIAMALYIWRTCIHKLSHIYMAYIYIYIYIYINNSLTCDWVKEGRVLKNSTLSNSIVLNFPRPVLL